jgi:hypothetical protein
MKHAATKVSATVLMAADVYVSKCYTTADVSLTLILCAVCRGRGMASTRFDPYLAHAGGAGGWMGRSDPYAAGMAGGDMYAQADPYRQPMLPAPPQAAVRPTPAYSNAAAGGGDDASFARDLLKLYSENPAAFDAYARDPIVRKSLKLDGQEASVAGLYDDSGLRASRDYYDEPRGLGAR